MPMRGSEATRAETRNDFWGPYACLHVSGRKLGRRWGLKWAYGHRQWVACVDLQYYDGNK